LFSFGAAGRAFRNIGRLNTEVNESQNRRRRLEHDEEELETQLKRALFLQEDSLKKRLEAPEAIEQFHKRPAVQILYARVQEIEAERRQYAERLAKGEVPADEQRERDFVERK